MNETERTELMMVHDAIVNEVWDCTGDADETECRCHACMIQSAVTMLRNLIDPPHDPTPLSIKRQSYNGGDNPEKRIADLWKRENERSPFYNSGWTTLEGILSDELPNSAGAHRPPPTAVSYRDAVVAATVIQWLGTPVGDSFLEKVVNACGYEMKR